MLGSVRHRLTTLAFQTVSELAFSEVHRLPISSCFEWRAFLESPPASEACPLHGRPARRHPSGVVPWERLKVFTRSSQDPCSRPCGRPPPPPGRSLRGGAAPGPGAALGGPQGRPSCPAAQKDRVGISRRGRFVGRLRWGKRQGCETHPIRRSKDDGG